MKPEEVEAVVYKTNYRENGEIRSIYQYIDRTAEWSKRKGCLVPKWAICLSCAFYIVIFAALIAGLVLIYSKPRDAIYLEKCQKTPCVKGLNLKCINGICNCDSGFIWSKKCIEKKNYMEKCHSTAYCKENKNLTCIDSTCACNQTQYWSGTTCVDKKTFNQTCKTDDACITKSFLYCNTTTGKCACDAKRFWDGNNVCYPKKTYNEKCSSTAQCKEWQYLVCSSSVCKCTSSQYWEPSLSTCKNFLQENGTCSATYQCYSPMTCTSSVCRCGSFQYHDLASLTCVSQSTFSEPCSIDYNCRVDKYLECQSGTCQCISAYPLWSYGFDKCIVPVTYNSLCYDSADCNSAKNLICNDGTNNCTCPTNVAASYCDCVRENNNENYWDGVNCVAAKAYNQTCSANHMCQTTTQGTLCNGAQCVCPANQYFKFSIRKCEPKVSHDVTCPQADACRVDLGLFCLGVCVCNTTIQFWDGTQCVNYYTYNSQTCTASGQCDTSLGLQCRLDANTCNCPDSVSGKCDCATRVANFEYYWNGAQCVLANTYNMSCSANYMCKYITELTSCNALTQRCDCGTNAVWDGEICKTCDAGWIFLRGSCFRESSSKWNNGFPISDCYGQATARLAILQNSDISVLNSQGLNDHYFDPSWVITNYVASLWSNSPNTDPCHRIQAGFINSHQCHNAHYWICEYVL